MDENAVDMFLGKKYFLGKILKQRLKYQPQQHLTEMKCGLRISMGPTPPHPSPQPLPLWLQTLESLPLVLKSGVWPWVSSVLTLLSLHFQDIFSPLAEALAPKRSGRVC